MPQLMGNEMLRKFLLCTVASAALFSGPAFAADLPVKAPPAPLPSWSWAGFYVGGHGGYGWKQNDFAQVLQTAPLAAINGVDSTGWVAGGHAGYNWQYDRWVAGVEVDGSATEIRGISNSAVRLIAAGTVTVTDTARDDVQYLGTARARLGVAPFANTDILLYGTAGLAWERVDRTATQVLATVGGFRSTAVTTPRDHFGWVAGVGGELRLGATNWIGRVEYLHYDFGTVEPVTTTSSSALAFSREDRGGRQTIDVVRAGLSYKFDGTASPLSAYAASMPVKAAPPASWSWAGFYIGGHGGYGWKQDDYVRTLPSAPPIPTIGGIDSRGWVAGGQAGYNWQYGRWVTGLEVDGSATQIRGETTVFRPFQFFTLTDTDSDDVKYLGTVRARVGGAVPFANTDVLLYGTGGLAWERNNRTQLASNVTINPPTTFTTTNSTPRDHFGWVAGAGAEVRLGATNWIGRVEYLHYDFGTVNPTNVLATTAPGSFTENGGRQTIDVVRGGLSYKFGAPSSPLSAYAASMPVKAALPPATWSWAGFYIGGHGGYGWKQNDFARVVTQPPDLTTVGGVDSRGWVLGGQAGYNWQFGSWIAGLELDASATQIRGESSPLIRTNIFGDTFTDTSSDDVKYLGTLRARVGGAVPFAHTDILLYGTAGLAWERVNHSDSNLINAPPLVQLRSTTTPRSHFGWAAGAGGEFRLGASNWIGRVEYLHYDFGTVEPVTHVVTGASNFADRAGRQTIDVVRGGVSYKFAAAP
jgi:outer membrane protein with beta-barrel domain